MGSTGQESHTSAGGRDLTGMKGREPPSCQASRQADLDPEWLSGPCEGFGVPPVLSRAKMPPPLLHVCPSSYPCHLASHFPPCPVSSLYLRASLTHTFSVFSSLQLEVALMAHLCFYLASL